LRLINNGLQTAEESTWEKAAGKLASVIDSMLSAE
jgi:hypothetical protein